MTTNCAWALPFLLALVLAAGAKVAVASSVQPGLAAWNTGCKASISVLEGFNVAMRGLQSLRITKPCKNITVHSSNSPKGGQGEKDQVPPTQSFKLVLYGHKADWVWRILGSPSMAGSWPSRATGERGTDSRTQQQNGFEVSWPKLFGNMYTVYRYVLATKPPTSSFSLYFFPWQKSLDREMTASTKKSIYIPLFIPYGFRTKKSSKPDSHRLSTLQAAYVLSITPTCFEYMHALFETKRLMALNFLTHSVAGRVTCTALKLLDFSHDPHLAMILPSVATVSAKLKRHKSELLQEGHIDLVGGLIAIKNMSHLLGGDNKKVTVKSTDTHKLLRLARAMVQKPVDFTKQTLYPLQNLRLIPEYTGTVKDITTRDNKGAGVVRTGRQ